MATAAAAPEQSFLCATPAPGRAYHPDGVELTYGAVRAEVLRLKDDYARAGYGHGHRVALLFENRPEFFFHYLAANALGVGVVPVNPDYRHDELAYQMDHSSADLAVAVTERVAATSGHQRRGLKRSGKIRQLAVRTAHVAVTAWQFMWKSGSGLRKRSRPGSMASRPPRPRYQAPAFR